MTNTQLMNPAKNEEEWTGSYPKWDENKNEMLKIRKENDEIKN